MTTELPYARVPRVPAHWDRSLAPTEWPWAELPTLPPFRLVNPFEPAQQQTQARICADAEKLYVRFDCDDRHIWGTFTQRDEHIYDEEVVEVFISPGPETPTRYYELEVSPNGVLLDAKIHNPTSERSNITVDFSWDCPNIGWWAGRNDAANHWWAILALPWAEIGAQGELPRLWRANFYRIERPEGGPDEFSCWSPTRAEPADFHKPAFFGTLELDEDL